ncbi:hypothetical protein GCM10010171_13420 [Actinokineospora fastidiosa]|uniref:Uncharacterized protein n=1 Tax=Actinokineospora fastidiosa TaxID=1816 RepID=A0A918G7S9_9PSEU|nr:hypothetical protein GCM10010171_13420 [Actinokineospora fastidiosa]
MADPATATQAATGPAGQTRELPGLVVVKEKSIALTATSRSGPGGPDHPALTVLACAHDHSRSSRAGRAGATACIVEVRGSVFLTGMRMPGNAFPGQSN